MKNLSGIAFGGIFLIFVLSFAGCASRSSAGNTAVRPQPGSGSARPVSMPEGFIPEYAVMEAERYKTDFLIEHSQAASDLKYRFFYNGEGGASLEYTVTAKEGYTWPTPKWVGTVWGSSEGSIGNNKIRYTLTKRLEDEAQYRMDERRKDPAFREIENIVLQIAGEYNYDFENAYGVRVKYRNPNVKKAVCDGYSDAAVGAFVNHPLVERVEKWSSSQGNHAWNVLVLKDGRKLYCDVTWYDGNSIDDEGYVVDIPDRNPVNLTFDIDEFNSLGGAVNTAGGRLLAVHFAWPDSRQL